MFPTASQWYTALAELAHAVGLFSQSVSVDEMLRSLSGRAVR